ncbi:hypothetical protein DSECCO2_495130 [anaerobic digester metagenome]
MVASYYLIKPFYSLYWRILNFISPRRETVFYVHSAIDLQNWLPVQKFLAQIPLVSDKANTRKELRDMGYRVRPLPVFPKAVIMCRVATHKFPSRKVIKVGMTHGAYHFKRMPKAENYHPFSLYLFTSPQDLANAEKIGIRIGKVGGYPKLDPYLQPSSPSPHPKGKKKLLFTATYHASGMSAIQQWLNRLGDLTALYDVFVSLHPWMDKAIKAQIAALPDVTYVRDNPLPYIAIADVCIVDNSSVIGEICALDKPMISFILPPSPRSVPEIAQVLDKCSIRIETFAELPAAIERALQAPAEFQTARSEANALFFDCLDGNAGKRSAEHILKLLPELSL